MLAEDLRGALVDRGHKADLLTVPFKWYPQETLVNNILACKLLDIEDFNGIKTDLTIGLKFPTWLIPHKKKSFWILHQHRTAYDLWDTEYCDIKHMMDGEYVREMIVRADSEEIGKSQNVYTISQTVSDRLKGYNNISSGVLYPPPRNQKDFHCESYEDYFFFPSRITPLKRQEVIIDALGKTKGNVKVVFAGEADNSAYLDLLKKKAVKLGVGKNIKWLGRVSEQDKFELYARALMVIFPPYDEDYGYITPEAMLSSKAVITFNDSGGPLEFVQNAKTGIVTSSDPGEVAQALDSVWSERSLAKEYGENAKQHIEEMDLSWNRVIGSLLK